MRKTLSILLGAALLITAVGCNSQSKDTNAAGNNTAQEQTSKSAPAKSTSDQQAAPEKKAVPGKDGYITTESGLKYKDIKEGKGAAVKAGDVVTVDYTGSLDNGKVFDSSKKPGRTPFSFKVGTGQVIKGWDEGLQGMKAGGVRDLKIPPELGYGDQDMGVIPPNSTLHFKIELHKIGQ